MPPLTKSDSIPVASSAGIPAVPVVEHARQADRPEEVGRRVVITALVLLSNLESDERWFGSIQTIVLAFDFSEPATRALRWADSFAQAVGARLELVHVHPDFEAPSAVKAVEGPWPQLDQMERYLRFLRQELRDVARDTLAERGDLVGLHVDRGDPVTRLIARANQLHADLIVVGATGKRAGERLFLGSVSEAVLRASDVPVAVIR